MQNALNLMQQSRYDWQPACGNSSLSETSLAFSVQALQIIP